MRVVERSHNGKSEKYSNGFEGKKLYTNFRKHSQKILSDISRNMLKKFRQGFPKELLDEFKINFRTRFRKQRQRQS